MRQREVCGLELQVIVDEKVDIYRAIMIPSADAFLHTSQLPFDALRRSQTLLGRQYGHDQRCSIQETVIGQEAPGLALVERRRTLHPSYTQRDEPQSLMNISLAVTQITAQSDV